MNSTVESCNGGFDESLDVWFKVEMIASSGGIATGSDVFGNARTHSRPVVPFGDFLPCFVLT